MPLLAQAVQSDMTCRDAVQRPRSPARAPAGVRNCTAAPRATEWSVLLERNCLTSRDFEPEFHVLRTARMRYRLTCKLTPFSECTLRHANMQVVKAELVDPAIGCDNDTVLVLDVIGEKRDEGNLLRFQPALN